MINQSDIPKEAELFTSCFYSHRDYWSRRSFFTFGFIDQELVEASGEEISWVDIDNSEGFWMFPSTRASVNGTEISLPGNKAIATIGAALALVSDEVCEALYKNIAGAWYSSKYQGYVIPKTTVANKRLPVFSVAVGDTDFIIHEDGLSFASADDSHWYGGV